jgi:hypothetical protein
MTKGEWGVIGNFVAVQMKDGNSYEICKVSMHDPEWKSNAQLITAAPDMYEALIKAKAVIASLKEERATLEIIQQALNKAEGKECGN